MNFNPSATGRKKGREEKEEQYISFSEAVIAISSGSLASSHLM